jgi:mannose-6-phosphate isomerase-like protein (cupin superfamily)
MRTLLLVLVLLPGCISQTRAVPALTQQRPQPAPALVLVGAVVERNYSTQPGIQLGYQPGGVRGHLRYGAAYSTTRLEVAMGSNALVEDRAQLSAAWHFHPERVVSPYAILGAGYTRFGRGGEEFELLDNSAPIVTAGFGFEGRLPAGVRANAGIGYSALQSSTVYPIAATLGVHLPLTRRADR